MTIVSLLGLVGGLLGIVAGIGMLRGKVWGRYAGIAYCAVFIVTGMGFGLADTEFLGVGFLALVLGGYCLKVLFDDSVNAYFAGIETRD